jgi:carbonic anhydrase
LNSSDPRSVTDQLLENNRRWAEGFDKGGLPVAPGKKLAVVACMDSRFLPSRVLGLEEGDAHIIRNAGGVVTDDTIRSLALSQHLLGTEEIVLIHHTDCGLEKVTDDEFRERMGEFAGALPPWRVEAFERVDDSVRESIRRIVESPFIAHKNVRGFVFDVDQGALREVDAPG